MPRFVHALLLVLALSACAGAGWVDDAAQIFAALQASENAWNRGDLKGHLAIYDESVTAMTKNGPRPGIAPIEAAFTKAYFRDGKPKQVHARLAAQRLGLEGRA